MIRSINAGRHCLQITQRLCEQPIYTHRMLFSSHHLKDSYENVIVEKKIDPDATNAGGGVGLITLNRPKALNALSDSLFADLIHAAKALDADDTIGCLVLTGSTKAFAAGADISEMKDRTFDYAYTNVSVGFTAIL
jgi:enoyl-CoA hydratase/carnithine racemase